MTQATRLKSLAAEGPIRKFCVIATENQSTLQYLLCKFYGSEAFVETLRKRTI